MIAAGRYDQAIRVLSERPAGSALWHRLMGDALQGRRRSAEALGHFREALALGGEDEAGRLGLARALMALAAPAEAIDLLEPMAAGREGEDPAVELLAEANRRDARYDEVLALVARVGRPGIQLCYEEALAHLYRGEAAESLAAFDRVLDQRPDHAAALFRSHGPALERLGWAEAERRLEKAAACRGANRRYQAMLAAYDLLRSGRPGRACPASHRHLAEGARAMLGHLAPCFRLFGVKGSLLRWGLQEARLPGLVLEFGVRRGASLRQLARAEPGPVHGFDSFEGLPEGWVRAPAGVMSTQGAPPPMPANVVLHKGWFADSLAPFLAGHAGPVRLANIDCDLYASARTVLWGLAGRIGPGSILVFDEYVGNRSWRQDEFKAFAEFVQSFGHRYEIVAATFAEKQVAVRILPP